MGWVVSEAPAELAEPAVLLGLEVLVALRALEGAAHSKLRSSRQSRDHGDLESTHLSVAPG